MIFAHPFNLSVMSYRIFYGLIPILLIFFGQCKSQMPVSENQQERAIPTAEEVAMQELGNEYEMLWNSNKSAALITKAVETGAQRPFPTLRVLVFHAATGKVLHEDTVPKAKVRWINEEEAEITSVPGVIRNRNASTVANGYIFNWVKKEKKQLK